MADNQPYLTSGSTKKSKSLIYQGYKYLKNKKKGDTTYWRCARLGCKVPMSTNSWPNAQANPHIIVKHEPRAHLHIPDGDLVRQDKFKADLRSSQVEDPSRSTHASYDNTLRTLHQGGGDIKAAPTYNQVRHLLYRCRKENMPPLPRELADVQIPPYYSETWAHDRFALHQNRRGNTGFLMFATDQDLEKLAQCDEFFMDATFRTAPHPYSQYFTIHGNYNEHVILLVSVLMTG